jgi:hypothetical protein
VSLAKETQRARVLLERGLLPHLVEALWRSALLTAFLMPGFYFLNPTAFDVADVCVTFAAVLVMHVVGTFFVLLLAAGRYRKRPSGE